MIDLKVLDTDGFLRRTLLDLPSCEIDRGPARPVSHDRFLAFAFVHADLNACLHAGGVDWVTGRGRTASRTKLALTNPVAAFPLPDHRELVVVAADGLLTRIPIPDAV